MASGGASAPSVNPGDHMKQRSAGEILNQESSLPSMPTLQPKDLNLTTPVSLPTLHSSAARN
eukprot:14745286-Ditylum_brightwellii.AAC.1